MAVLKINDGSNFVDIANFDSVPKVTPTTDNAIARYDGTTGLLQDTSVATISDAGDMLIAGDLDCQDMDAATDATIGGTLDVTGAVTVSSTVDGRDIAADGTKLDGAVLEADYNANTVLAATSDDTPAALTVAEDTVVGRITGGNIAAIKGPSVAEVLFGDTFNSWVSNKWYTQSPGYGVASSNAGIALTANIVHYFPLLITHRVTFDNVGFQVGTAEAGKNARIAIYNASAGAPTTVVVESGNITLAGTGNLSVAVAATTLQAGQYFWAVNADSTTAVVYRTQANLTKTFISLGASFPGNTPDCRYAEASAFGVFPDPATPGTAANISFLPLLKFQVV